MVQNKALIFNRLDQSAKELVLNGINPNESIHFEGRDYSVYELRGLIRENQRELGESPAAFGPGFNNNFENYPPLKPTKETIRQVENYTQDEIEFGQGVENVEEIRNPIDNVFIPTWDNMPPEHPPVLSLNGVGILTYQNLSAIIAAQGMGKSSVCEAILAGFLNPECDSLGFEVDPSITGVVYIDFERTNTDVWNSFYRMAKRAGIQRGQDIDNVLIAGMRSIPRLEERKSAIITFIKNNPLCKLLLLDGAGDLITDSNDLPQAIECRIWIRELTVKYGISIFTSIHPNPGTLKPRGHIGSEIVREAEGVMAIQKDKDLRIIFSDFDYGKNRNNAHVWGAYEWDDNEKMMCRRDVPEYLTNGQGKPKKGKMSDPDDFGPDFHIKLLHMAFHPEAKLTSEAFYARFAEVWDKKENGNMSRTRAIAFKKYHLANRWICIDPTRGPNNESYHELDASIMFIDGLF